MAIEIVDLPIKKMSFSIVMWTFTREPPSNQTYRKSSIYFDDFPNETSMMADFSALMTSVAAISHYIPIRIFPSILNHEKYPHDYIYLIYLYQIISPIISTWISQ